VTKRCHEHEIEIVAAAGGKLDVPVQQHLERCSGCRKLREETLAMAGAARADVDAPAERIRAIARDAVRVARGRRWALWAAPLLSASASAAALIIYFGIFHAAAEVADADAAAESTQTMTEATQVMLPDSLRAVSDLLLEQTEQESKR